MRIVITGAAGFIGSNLTKFLLAENLRLNKNEYEIVGIDDLSYGLIENVPPGIDFHRIDIRNRNISELFKGNDIIFHLAAKNCISDCQQNPVETAGINVTGTVNVFEAARIAGVQKIVYAESSAIYEGSRIFPTPETETKPESFYAVSKASAMLFAEAYRKFYGLKFTALRYFCVYGPVQDYRRTIPPLMSSFIIRLLKGEQPVIYGTGEKKRDFIFVDDINDFHLMCLTDPRTDNGTFNLGSGTNHSVREIYDFICELLGLTVEPEYRPDLPGEAQTTLADITKAEELGWRSKTNLITGLKAAIQYIKGELGAGRI
jgi:UDP-glucose 4-epimerase